MSSKQGMDNSFTNKTIFWTSSALCSGPLSHSHWYELSNTRYKAPMERFCAGHVNQQEDGKMFVKALRSLYEKSRIEHWNTNHEKLTVLNNSKGPVPRKRRTVSGKDLRWFSLT